MCDKRSKEEKEALYAEYEMLEALGLLLRLPCKIGTTVYHVCVDDCGNMSCLGYCRTCKDAYCKILPTEFDYWHIPQFGETVFLTQEEAVEKLEIILSNNTKNNFSIG